MVGRWELQDRVVDEDDVLSAVKTYLAPFHFGTNGCEAQYSVSIRNYALSSPVYGHCADAERI